MKSLILGLVLVFSSSFANAMSWSELAKLLDKNCPMNFPGNITTTRFVYTGKGLIEFVKLGQINKDKLPSVYKEYMVDIKAVHKEFAKEYYKELGPLNEGGTWQLQFDDILGRHLQSYNINFKTLNK